jgi:MerR family mercuric resistance operon transcriptional regulator
MKEVTIAGLARAGGVGVETVRYYQRRALMPVPKANAGIRRYGTDELRRLRFIRSAQAAGFTLEQIAELLALHASNGRKRASLLARQRIAALDEKITELKRARNALSKLANACNGATSGPCPILLAFET